ncbi:hypothetical protein KEM54_005126 [Ascosphaera aggregata]|nr:hypothetical protein KEM54_005126 [Ascosphaera aggregata]
MSYGGTIVPKMNLVLSMMCEQYLYETHSKAIGLPGPENPQCRVPEVQSRTATFILLFTLIPGALSAFAVPKYGAASDGHGRMKMLAIAAFVTMISDSTFLLVALKPHVFHLDTLLLGAVLEGLGGSATAIMALCTSYAADCTPSERRNVAFGYFHGVFFVGLALGPMLAGMIIKHTGNTLHVFYVSMACNMVFLICVLFVVPESLSMERQQENRERHEHKYSSRTRKALREMNPSKLFEPLSVFFPRVDAIDDPKQRKVMRAVKKNLLILAALDTIVFGVKLGSSGVIIIYAEYLFGWGNVESMLFVSLVSTIRMVMLIVAMPILTRLIRGPRQGDEHINTGCDMLDIGVIRSSVFIDVLCYLVYACSTTGTPFIVAGAIDAIGAMVSPTLQSSLTKHAQPNQTGQVLGAIGLLHSLSKAVVPTIFSLLYSKTVGIFPQAIYVALMVIAASSLCLSLFLKPHVLLHKNSAGDTEDNCRYSTKSDYTTLPEQ